MGRPRRKFILLLVEGMSDQEILFAPIASFFENVYAKKGPVDIRCFRPAIGDERGGDITSFGNVSPQTIEKDINRLFLRDFFEKSNPYVYPKEIAEVVHIVDLDGAFVPSLNIINALPDEMGSEAPYYDDSLIITSRVDLLIKRNEQKSANLKFLCEMDKIEVGRGSSKKKVPYRVFFFSSNIDHCIHGNANIPSEQKVEEAVSFSYAHGENWEQFVDYIHDNGVTLDGMTYAETWSYVSQGVNSLARCTNINLLFERS